MHGGKASGRWVRHKGAVLARQGESREVRGPQEPRAQPEATGAPRTGVPGVAVSSLCCGRVLKPRRAFLARHLCNRLP